MTKRLLMIAAAIAVICSCSKSEYWGSFEVSNNCSKTIHVESTFISADGNGCHSADIDWEQWRCQLCRSQASSTSREFAFEDIVTNPSEGKVTVSCEGKVIFEWTSDMKEYLFKGDFAKASKNGMVSLREYGTAYFLSFLEDKDGNIVAETNHY